MQIMAVFILLILSFVVGAFISQFISFKKEKPIVREPLTPEESRLTYTPLPADVECYEEDNDAKN